MKKPRFWDYDTIAKMDVFFVEIVEEAVLPYWLQLQRWQC